MALEDKLDRILDEAEDAGKTVEELVNLLTERNADREVEADREDVIGVMPVLSEAKWEALKVYMRRKPSQRSHPERIVKRIARALRQDDQAAFWEAALPGLRTLRAQLPHLQGEFENGPQQ